MIYTLSEISAITGVSKSRILWQTKKHKIEWYRGRGKRKYLLTEQVNELMKKAGWKFVNREEK